MKKNYNYHLSAFLSDKKIVQQMEKNDPVSLFKKKYKVVSNDDKFWNILNSATIESRPSRRGSLSQSITDFI